ncbi:hypothetical protein FACS1894104_5040 [Actinomycetota bacterium]|nr:hypothetical protein FACS1894104_5040 [Actinomycetota bacterium]
MPSPNRCLGITSPATVVAAVLVKPQANPKSVRITSTNAMEGIRPTGPMVSTIAINPKMKKNFLPIESTPAPANGLVMIAVIVVTPAANPNKLLGTPSSLK